jgi:hypothetical protein
MEKNISVCGPRHFRKRGHVENAARKEIASKSKEFGAEKSALTILRF